MIINHYLTEFVLSCVFRKVIYREQQDSPFFLLYSRQNAEKLQFVVHKFCLAKLQNVAQKALGKARKSGAEGESLKLVSYFYSVFRVKLYLYAKSRRLFPISVIWLSFKPQP